MKITILRGTNQIGGCVTEIESSRGTKIIIDIGENLPAENGRELPELNVDGLKEGKEDVDAIFVTHYHGDHIGLFNKVSSKIPIYIGEISKQMYMMVAKKLATANIVNKEDIERINNFIGYKIKQRIKIEDILITPIEVDHSAFDAHMLLIECDGKKVLHTGDFRIHGQRGKAVIPALKKYVGEIDGLVCEGTTLSREQVKSKTETDLVDDIAQKTKNYDEVLMLMSTTNIDRVTTMQKVANKNEKKVIHDIVLSNILQLVTQRIPNALNSKDVGVFLPTNYYIKKDKEEYKQYIEQFQERINETGKMLYGKFIMNIRVSMLKDIERLKTKNNVLNNCCVVYSMWEGYKQEKMYRKFLDKMKELKIDVFNLHVSGHADCTAFNELINITKPEAVIPIHTENKEKIKSFTNKAVILNDMETYEF